MDRRIVILFTAITGMAMVAILVVRLQHVRQVTPSPTATAEVAQVEPTTEAVRTAAPIPTRQPTEPTLPIEVTVVVTATPTDVPTEQPTEVPTHTPTLQPTIESFDDGRVDNDDEAAERLVVADVATNADEVICSLQRRFSTAEIVDQPAFKCFPYPGTVFTNPIGEEPVGHAFVLQADGQVILALEAPAIISSGSDDPPADTTYRQPDKPEPPASDPPEPIIDQPSTDEGSGPCEECQAPSTFVPDPVVPSDTAPEEPMPTAIF